MQQMKDDSNKKSGVQNYALSLLSDLMIVEEFKDIVQLTAYLQYPPLLKNSGSPFVLYTSNSRSNNIK